MDQIEGHLDRPIASRLQRSIRTSAPRRPRRLRFSLRALLITIAVVAAMLVIANNYLRPKIEHRIAVGRIFDSGGAIWFQDKSQEAGLQNPYTTPGLKLNLWSNVDSIDIKNDAQANGRLSGANANS